LREQSHAITARRNHRNALTGRTTNRRPDGAHYQPGRVGSGAVRRWGVSETAGSCHPRGTANRDALTGRTTNRCPDARTTNLGALVVAPSGVGAFPKPRAHAIPEALQTGTPWRDALRTDALTRALPAAAIRRRPA